ncbi:hypothetical protein V565_213120, partial [Rhizoctonia solani 123E]
MLVGQVSVGPSRPSCICPAASLYWLADLSIQIIEAMAEVTKKLGGEVRHVEDNRVPESPFKELDLDLDAEFGGTEERKKLEKKLLRKIDGRMSIMVIIYILNS